MINYGGKSIITITEFIEKMDKFISCTGMDGLKYDKYLSVSEDKEINSSIFFDTEGQIWLAGQYSVKRIKTSINVSNVKEFRYD